MRTEAHVSRTTPSNRMKHGLRSRARSEERQCEALDLIKLLARPACSSPMVQAAAADVADAVLHLAAVRDAIRDLITPAQDPGRNAPPDVDEELEACFRRLQQEAQELANLRDYERKVLSRRKAAIRRLDYAILEARRQRQVMIAEEREQSGKLDLWHFR